MTERTHHDSPADGAPTDDPQLRPQSSEDDYSGRDGGTSNAEAVQVGLSDAKAGRAAVPEETRSPAPPQPDVPTV